MQTENIKSADYKEVPEKNWWQKYGVGWGTAFIIAGIIFLPLSVIAAGLLEVGGVVIVGLILFAIALMIIGGFFLFMCLIVYEEPPKPTNRW